MKMKDPEYSLDYLNTTAANKEHTTTASVDDTVTESESDSD